MQIGDSVTFNFNGRQYGKIIGRTFERWPRYDVKADDGSLFNGLCEERLQLYTAVEPVCASDGFAQRRMV